MASDVYSEFEWRGMVYEATDGARDALRDGTVTCYIGFDPTASSLHVGSLLQIMALARLQRFGHHAIAIAGGGTGMVGDPSGKSQERTLLSLEEIEANLRGIKQQLAHFLDFDQPVNPARIINNADWLTKLNLMEFLRDIGKHFTVNYMLAKESVRRRLEQEDGISFTEFSYLMLQAYDFLTLYDRHGCTVQMGGSDQWGNITAGIDLIRRLRGARAHGLVLPLVTSAAGTKFGKTEAGTIWLDERRTSAFRFYQFWLNTDDRDVITYLKYFTFFGEDEIVELERELARAPETRDVQRRLAREVTRLVHGEEAVSRAERASGLLFGEGITELNVDEVLEVFGDVPSTEVERDALEGSGILLADLLVRTALVSSKSEATRLIRNGGIYVNNRRVSDERARLTADQGIASRVFVLRKGARQQHLVKLTG
jgi:tyrosyl-tRNA synthetase